MSRAASLWLGPLDKRSPETLYSDEDVWQAFVKQNEELFQVLELIQVQVHAVAPGRCTPQFLLERELAPPPPPPVGPSSSHQKTQSEGADCGGAQFHPLGGMEEAAPPDADTNGEGLWAFGVRRRGRKRSGAGGGGHAHGNTARKVVGDQNAEESGQQKRRINPHTNQHNPSPLT